jgi:hypothetical protein
VPAGTVEDQQSDGAEADGLANFSQMLVRASMLTLGMTNAAPGKTYFRSPASFSSALHCAIILGSSEHRLCRRLRDARMRYPCKPSAAFTRRE